MATRITLLTDFGTADGYVAAMKGVIVTISHDAIVDDAGHTIEPGDVMGAALALERYWRRYPPNTVHIVVVDPGVGSARGALAISADNRYLVGPDNGVFTFVTRAFPEFEAYDLSSLDTPTASISPTFHGRDLFAPAAAHMARGRKPDRLGVRVTKPVELKVPEVSKKDGVISGSIIHVDHFGNLITNIMQDTVNSGRVRLGKTDVGSLRRAYADVESGGPIAVFGSNGRLEIAVRDDHAAKYFKVGRGAKVEIDTTK
jgi:S-adenosyl-L-methionine hydrolase (adenosine-forming)